MRFDKDLKPSGNVEDQRGQGGGFGVPGGGGRRINIPMGGSRGGGMSISTIVLLVLGYFALKFLFGVDLLDMMNGGGGGMQLPGGQSSTEYQMPDTNTDVAGAPAPKPTAPGTTDVTTDAGKQFVDNVLSSTEVVWKDVFQKMGREYPEPNLVMFSGFVQSACGAAQSAMGPFYCPRDQKVYIDLSFYQDMKNKLGAPGDFAQAYVIAHEVGHHIQTVFGIAEKVQATRMRVSTEEGNALQVRMELQADCLAGIWAQEASAKGAIILDDGDIEEGLNAAAAIGDDRLQKRSQGYVVPESFTHGSSAQRVAWFKRGMNANSLQDCDTFGAEQL
jgi:uncharacterized protein